MIRCEDVLVARGRPALKYQLQALCRRLAQCSTAEHIVALTTDGPLHCDVTSAAAAVVAAETECKDCFSILRPLSRMSFCAAFL